jgi:hypothetical protein
LQEVARSATSHAPLEAVSTITASTEFAVEVPRVTPAHAHEPEQPNPLTAMRLLLGEAAIAALRACLVHGDPVAVVVLGGAVLVGGDALVSGAAAGDPPHPANIRPATRQRPNAPEHLRYPCRGRNTTLLTRVRASSAQ